MQSAEGVLFLCMEEKLTKSQSMRNSECGRCSISLHGYSSAWNKNRPSHNRYRMQSVKDHVGALILRMGIPSHRNTEGRKKMKIINKEEEEIKKEEGREEENRKEGNNKEEREGEN
jgi:hypothetical protein